MSAPNDM